MKPYLRVANVFEDRIDATDVKQMHFDKEEFERYRLVPGDVLLNEGQTPELLGRPAIYQGQPGEVAFTNSLIRFKARGGIDPRWALIVFRHHMHSGRFTRESRITTNIAHLSASRFKSIEFPVPPIGEQRRIVEILEDLLSRLDAAEAQLEQGQMRATAFFAAVADATIFKPGWSTLPVRDLLREGLRNGHSAPATSGPGAVRTLTLTAVTKDDFSDRYTKLTKADRVKVRGLWLEPGDILVQRSNTPELVGSVAMYRGPRDWAIFPDLLIRIRPDEERVTAEYLVRVLQTERIHRLLRSRAKGLAGSMPKIDQGAIADLQVPVPPQVQMQTGVVTRMRGAANERDGLVTACLQARRRSVNLRRAVLAAAFSGKLTSARDVSEVVEEMAGV